MTEERFVPPEDYMPGAPEGVYEWKFTTGKAAVFDEMHAGYSLKGTESKNYISKDLRPRKEKDAKFPKFEFCTIFFWHILYTDKTTRINVNFDVKKNDQ